MPPKKSATAAADEARKSDLSTARFVPIESAQTPEPAAEPAAAPTHTATAAADESAADAQSQADKKDGGKKDEKDAVTIEDLTLPKSIVTRLAKGVLPPNTQIQANAILAMSKSATVFINYLASHANEHTFNANKKTISPADVFKALDDIEFGFLKEPLEAEFAKFTALQAEKRNNSRKKSTGAKPEDADMADASTISAADTTMDNGSAAPSAAQRTRDGDDQARATKKQRVGDAAAAGGATQGASETEDEIDATVDEEREVEEDDDDDDEVEEEEDEEDQEDSGDETQDALEERPRREDGDEALDGDDSD
ncbi:histone-fold-containing protein [Sarocladium strictum]